jgi:hypothetical protein
MAFMKSDKIYYWLAWALVISGSIITIAYFVVLNDDGWRFWGQGRVDIAKTGAFGDYVGGFIGTLFSLAGFVFLFLTLKEQRLSFQKERFENHFFELVKLHRENVSELSYTKFHNGEYKTGQNRKVFKEIFREFEECLIEVRRFENSQDADVYYLPKYKREITNLFSERGLNVNLIDLATSNIAYCIVFFGVGKEGEMVLRKLFQKKYKPAYILHVLNFIKLKPKKENTIKFANWLALKSLAYQDLRKFLHNLYYYRRIGRNISLSTAEEEIFTHLKLEKYYGGHHHRLGHYFRLLFQTYKFLAKTKRLTRDEKYFYGKTLRAQLSTYEQAILFINSISCIGMKWELSPEIDRKGISKKTLKDQIANSRLITNYNLIKNLPSTHIYGLYFKDYYPLVNYESDEV